jgi:hypothetical protein
MIISVTCLHGTKANISRREICQELLSLSDIEPNITRSQVVFGKDKIQTFNAHLVTCHLSVQIPNIQTIDIFELQPSEDEAFDLALERTVKVITQTFFKQSLRQENKNLLKDTKNETYKTL